MYENIWTMYLCVFIDNVIPEKAEFDWPSKSWIYNLNNCCTELIVMEIRLEPTRIEMITKTRIHLNPVKYIIGK